MKNKCRIALAASLVLNTLLLPVAINQHLRLTYEFTLAHWQSKIIRPDRVMIGDSITAGGGDFGRFGTLNLAENGYLTSQIATMLKIAQAYNPRHIFVMAGVNDIFYGADAPEKLTEAWKPLLADRRVIVTLVPHGSNPQINTKIDALNALVEGMARKTGHRIIRIPGLTRPDGTIQPRYTVDGTHLTPPAYAIWRAQIG